MKTKPYVGLKASEHKREVFKSGVTPTEHSHGHLYMAVIGPFQTMRGATFMAEFGANNPHCQCVSDAERLGKKYEVQP